MSNKRAKINALIIGAGHYATGATSILGHKATDKDLGVLLPSVMALQQMGVVADVAMVATDGDRIERVRRDWVSRARRHALPDVFRCYPAPGVIDRTAYLEALKNLPRPGMALIAVPDYLHKDVMMACIAEGIHFLVVKPAVTRLDDLYELTEAMKGKPVFGMVDYHKVFDEANILLKDEYQQGYYGRLQHAMSLMTQRRDMIDIYSKQLGENNPPNINHYLGSHYIHMVGYMTGARPLDVRAIPQFGVADKMLMTEGVADLIETQIRWLGRDGSVFTSYHVSGWSDPPETESMTYQELHLISENGHVDSDQRYRGFRRVLAGQGYSALNPYFFGLTGAPGGGHGLNTKYGFISVKTFVERCADFEQGLISFEQMEQGLPTLKESAAVTAVLEAADLSMANDSSVVKIRVDGDRYQIAY